MRSTVAHIGFWVYNIDMSTVLTAGQADAENLVAHWFYHSDRQTFVLTGFAGTGKTALLITWLYKLTVDKNDYNLGAVIGIMTFVVLAVVSLITYRNSGSYKNEETFR